MVSIVCTYEQLHWLPWLHYFVHGLVLRQHLEGPGLPILGAATLGWKLELHELCYLQSEFGSECQLRGRPESAGPGWHALAHGLIRRISHYIEHGIHRHVHAYASVELQ